MKPHPAAMRYVEKRIPDHERRRVLWRDDADAGRTATGVMIRRQCWGGHLVRVVVRLDSDPSGPPVAVSPNDLEDLGPADAPAPFPPATASARPIFAVIQGGAA